MSNETMTLEPDGYVVLLPDKKSSPHGFARAYLTNKSAMELASKNALAEVRPFVFADTHAVESERLTAELEKLREDAERLVPHAKWLRECGLELAHDGHYEWGNTLTMAAEAIEAARRPL